MYIRIPSASRPKIPLLAEEGWRDSRKADAPGAKREPDRAKPQLWSVRRNVCAGLQLRPLFTFNLIKDDLSKYRALFHKLMPPSHFPQRENSIDHRLQLPAKHALHHIEEVTLAAHC